MLLCVCCINMVVCLRCIKIYLLGFFVEINFIAEGLAILIFINSLVGLLI